MSFCEMATAAFTPSYASSMLQQVPKFSKPDDRVFLVWTRPRLAAFACTGSLLRFAALGELVSIGGGRRQAFRGSEERKVREDERLLDDRNSRGPQPPRPQGGSLRDPVHRGLD
jgi:hypothetical protein